MIGRYPTKTSVIVAEYFYSFTDPNLLFCNVTVGYDLTIVTVTERFSCGIWDQIPNPWGYSSTYLQSVIYLVFPETMRVRIESHKSSFRYSDLAYLPQLKACVIPR